MINWQEIVQKYIARHSDLIRRVSRPLRERFGIDYFTYHKIDSQGRYTVLLDRPDWAEHYVSEQYFLQDPYLRHPTVYRSGLSYIDAHGSKAYRERIMRNAKELFEWDAAVMIIERSSDAVEFFGFAGNRGSCRLESIAMNQPGLLRAFGAHFKRELAPLLSQMGEEEPLLPALKGGDFYRKDPIVPVMCGNSHLFLEDLGLGGLVKQAKQLSSREKDCLGLLGEGRSAKETAFHLELSHRTVESYLESVKNKLGLSSKQDLASVAKSFKDLGLLP